MTEKHLSSQFDAELNNVSGMVMEMGGLVEQQMRQAVEAMVDYNAEVAMSVLKAEPQVNTMEMEIDHELTSIIGRRQPTARDLRLLIAISRATGNLERAGDEAANRDTLAKESVLDRAGVDRDAVRQELAVGFRKEIVRRDAARHQKSLWLLERFSLVQCLQHFVLKEAKQANTVFDLRETFVIVIRGQYFSCERIPFVCEKDKARSVFT